MKIVTTSQIKQSHSVLLFFFIAVFLLMATEITTYGQVRAATNAELNLQTDVPEDTSVTFQLTPVSVEWCTPWGEPCNLLIHDGSSACEITLNSEEIIDDNGFYFQNCDVDDDCDGKEGTFRLGLYKIELYINDDDVYKRFYYDNRDCHFVGGCSSYSGSCESNDICVRVIYNSGSNSYSIKYAYTLAVGLGEINANWSDVDDYSTINWFDNDNCDPHCEIDYAGPPQTPGRISISGEDGENPVLSWTGNSESDLDGYKIYRSDQGSAYILLVTVAANVTSYTDNDVTISDDWKDPDVCYKHLAFDDFDNESGYSIPRCVDYSAMSKSVHDEMAESNLYNYNLFPNYPNPFNPETKINYSVPTSVHVSIKVYDTNGNEITTLINEQKDEGNYSIVLNLGKVNNYITSGIYIVTMKAGSYLKSMKIDYLK